MRTMLDVDERTARKLRELASARGLSVDQLLATHVPGLRPANGSGANAEETLTAFEQWAESFSPEAAPLSDEAVSRASIYRER